MNYKKTTYVVLENYPSILKSKIPLIQIFMSGIYFSLAPFIFTLLFFKRGFSIFRKKDSTFGAEKTFLINHIDLLTLKDFNFEDDDVLSTESFYLGREDSLKQTFILEKKGFPIKKSISGTFRIKKQVELCFSKNQKEDLEFVVISVPTLALKINLLFKKLRLI